MRVNSPLVGFFTSRLMVRSGFAIAMVLFINTACLSAILCHEKRGHTALRPWTEIPNKSDRDFRAKQLNIIIREIGHRLLLHAGDSTSLVLPVTETTEGTFRLQVENQFFFNHDTLIELAQALLPKTEFPSGYTVTVHDCLKAAIVYGFQINTTSPDILACRGRTQPSGCYLIEFTFPDFYKKVENEKADIEPLAEERKSFSVDAHKANAKRKEIKSTVIESEREEITEVLASTKVVSPNANGEVPKLRTATSDYSLINAVYIGMLVSLGASLLIVRLIPAPLATQKQTATNESVHELPALGKFLFDVKSQRLLMGGEAISLTDKECKILELLNASFGELIPRETLMQKVWFNEGVITGRSLDMFISKLRKKLSSDPELKITNVHGKGYTLEIVSEET